MKNPYSLLPIAAMCLTGYFLTLMLVRMKVLSLPVHRKIWNTILLVTFLVTGILGILLVLNLNYRLEWTWIKAALRWHVHFGIGMAVVAAFHLSWHLKYYLKIFAKNSNGKIPMPEKDKQTVRQELSDPEVKAFSFLPS